MSNSIEVKTFTGKYELISDGIINLIESEFVVQISNIKIVFKFEKDETQNTYFNSEADVDNNTLYLHIFNMQNGLLEGFYTPKEIGTIGGRKFFASFAAWSLDPEKNIRTVVYNLFFERS